MGIMSGQVITSKRSNFFDASELIHVKDLANSYFSILQPLVLFLALHSSCTKVRSMARHPQNLCIRRETRTSTEKEERSGIWPLNNVFELSTFILRMSCD